MVRIIFLILIILSALLVNVWLTLPFVIVYAMRWFAPELMLLAFLIDGYFEDVVTWPVFTIATFLIIILTSLTRRYLKFA